MQGDQFAPQLAGPRRQRSPQNRGGELSPLIDMLLGNNIGGAIGGALGSAVGAPTLGAMLGSYVQGEMQDDDPAMAAVRARQRKPGF